MFGLVGFASAQVMPFALNEQELPAPGQVCLFGADTFTLDAPALQSAIGFVPSGVVFTGKKILEVASVLHAQGCRFDCL